MEVRYGGKRWGEGGEGAFIRRLMCAKGERMGWGEGGGRAGGWAAGWEKIYG